MERRTLKILEYLFSFSSLLFLVLWIFLKAVPSLFNMFNFFQLHDYDLGFDEFMAQHNLIMGLVGLEIFSVFTNIYFILVFVVLTPGIIFNVIGSRMDKKSGNIPLEISDSKMRKQLVNEKIRTKKQLKEKRAERFQKIIRNYDVISLTDMAKLLWFKDIIELQGWLMDAFEGSPMKIRKDEVVIHSGGNEEEIESEIDELLNKYREWERLEYGKI